MRTKLLIAIACLLGLCIGFCACVKGNDEQNTEMNISTYVTAFGIDTINGKYYNFSIDQVNHLIFNADSLPVGSDTLLNDIAIDTFSASGYITSGLLDSIVIVGNKVDLTPAINKPGLIFKIIANDGSRSQDYSLQVNVHKVDPGAASWKNLSGLPAEFLAAKSTDHKVLMKGNDLMVLLRGNLLMKADVSDVSSYSWKTDTMTGLPDDALLHSTLCFDDTLYMISSSGDVFNSLNGSIWQKNDALSGGVKTLLAAFSDKLTAVKEVDGDLRFCLTTASTEAWMIGEPVQSGFPVEKACSDVYVSGTGVERAILVGLPLAGDGRIVPWMTIDGDDWGPMTTDTKYFCPTMDNPSVIYYNDFFYIVGNKLNEMYESIGGLVWGKSAGKFQMPIAAVGHDHYALTVDDSNFIWLLVIGEGDEDTQLWRGRMNELNN